MKKTFEIEWADSLGENWLNASNLVAALCSYCPEISFNVTDIDVEADEDQDEFARSPWRENLDLVVFGRRLSPENDRLQVNPLVVELCKAVNTRIEGLGEGSALRSRQIVAGLVEMVRYIDPGLSLTVPRTETHAQYLARNGHSPPATAEDGLPYDPKTVYDPETVAMSGGTGETAIAWSQRKKP